MNTSSSIHDRGVKVTGGLIFALVLLVIVSGSTGGIAAATGGVIVSPGTTFQASDDGPTITITEELELDDPFFYTDGQTVDLSPYAVFTSDGDTNVTVDRIGGTWTNVTTHDVAAGLEIDATDKQTVTVTGTDLESIHISDVDPGTTDEAELIYDANAEITLVVTDLPEGTKIDAIDVTTGDDIARATANESGEATFTLHSGAYAITFVETELYAGGDGTEAKPYQIEDWNHLDNVRENLDANFILVNDLDENGAGYDEVAGETAHEGAGFDPIGESGAEFTGAFDGNHATISDLYIDRETASDVGLFGNVGSGGVIENVGVEDVQIQGNDNVGGLVGRSTGTVRASYVVGTVDGAEAVGGLVGKNEGGDVTDSYGMGAVGENSSGFAVGGLIGSNSGFLETSYATGTVDGTVNVGGLVGETDGGNVSMSYFDTGPNNGVGAELTTDEMQRFGPLVTMDGFDFDGTWTVTSEYPRFDWEDVDELVVDDLETGTTTEAAGEMGEITVTAFEGGTDTGLGVTIEVIENDALSGLEVGETATTDAEGNANFEFEETNGGTYGLEFAWKDENSVRDTTTVSIVPGNPKVLKVKAQPADSTASGVVAGPPTVHLTDAFNNPISDVDVLVSANATVIDGTLERSTNENGLVAFDDLVIEDAGDYELEFAANGIDKNVTSNAFTITATQATAPPTTDLPDTNETGDSLDPEAQSFELSALTVPDRVEQHESFDVSVLVTNAGDDAYMPVVLTISGTDIEETQTHVIAAGVTETVLFEELLIDEEGEYTVEVTLADDRITKTVLVGGTERPAEDPAVTNDRTDVEDDSVAATLVLGIALILGALLVGVFFKVRWRT